MPNKREIRLCHVASFSGNVGDNASHNGLYASLSESTGWDLQPNQVEIRRAYLNYDGVDRLDWQTDFISLSNASDLTIVGGGNFLAPWIESSRSGTTIDLADSDLDRLSRPVVFHAIGFDPYLGSSASSLDKVRLFLRRATTLPNVLVAVRNDGSRQNLQSVLGEEIAGRVLRVPDPGFFVQIPPAMPDFCRHVHPYVAINLAVDMTEKRFGRNKGDAPEQRSLTYEEYLGELVNWLEMVTRRFTRLSLLFVPHISSDLLAIHDLAKRLPESLRRNRIHVAPCLQGQGAEKTVFAAYRNAELAVGNRFHTSVCSIGMGVPSIGLATYPKLLDLYQELGIPSRAISGNSYRFAEKLYELTCTTLEGSKAIREMYGDISSQLKVEARLAHSKISEMVHASF